MRLFIQNSIGAIIPANRDLVGVSLPNKVKAVKPFVFIIYATNQGCPPMQSQQSTSHTYKVGDILTINGVKGIVFEVSEDGRHGKAVSVKRSPMQLQWASDAYEAERLIGANSEYDGAYNMAKVKQIAAWRSSYPAFVWCAELGEGWYIPAKGELLAIYRNRAIIDKSLSSINEDPLYYWLWSSTEHFERVYYCAKVVRMYDCHTPEYVKKGSAYVRAVFAF